MKKQGRRWLLTTVVVAALTAIPAVEAMGLPVDAQVDVPKVNVPKLVPDTQLPDLPGGGDSISVPQLPQLPGGEGGGGGLPSGPDPGSLLGDGSGGSATGGGASPAGASPAGASPSASASSAAPPSSQAAPSQGATAPSASGGSRQSAGAERRAAERRLREAVAELAGCVASLSGRERPVAVMRAGLYGLPAVSRARVAKRLDISVRRVAALERSAVSSLHEAARDEGCGRNAPPASADVASVPPLISNASMSTMPALADPESMGSGGSDETLEVKGASKASSDEPGASPAAAGLPPSDDAGGLPLVLGLLLMLLLFGIFLALGVALQRRRMPAAAAPGAGAAHVSAEPVVPVAPPRPVEPIATDAPAAPVEAGPEAGADSPRPAPPVADPRPPGAEAPAAGRQRHLRAPAAIVASGIASLLISRMFKGGFASRVLSRARRR